MDNKAIAQSLLKLAREIAGEPREAADTFKCPTCGTKVLEQTGYCVKCKKKVKEAAAQALLKIARELTSGSREATKIMDFNKVPNKDDFQKWKLKDASEAFAGSWGRQTTIGDVLFFLNMAAMAWEDKQK